MDNKFIQGIPQTPDDKNEKEKTEKLPSEEKVPVITKPDVQLENLKKENEEKNKKNIQNLKNELGVSSTEATSSLEQQANYAGDWTLLSEQRFKNPEIKKKYIRTKLEHPSLGSEDPTEKFHFSQSITREEVEKRINDYDATIEHVFSATEFGKAAEFTKNPKNLGKGNYGKYGSVFSDAEHDNGEVLSSRQKNIIEAHEKVHGIFVGLTPGEQQEIRSGFSEPLEKYKGRLQGDEYLARMSQLKNYFGFKGDEPFTKKHLQYAREHYINDTGLDNTMSTFFRAITPDKEDKFVELMNKYAS